MRLSELASIFSELTIYVPMTAHRQREHSLEAKHHKYDPRRRLCRARTLAEGDCLVCKMQEHEMVRLEPP